MRTRLRSALLPVWLGLLGLCTSAIAQPVPGVASENKAADAARRAARRQLPSLRGALPSAFPHRLASLSAADFPEMVPEGQSLTGVHRPVASDVLRNGAWHPLPGGGKVWRLALESTGAAGLRVHFEDFQVRGGRVWLHDGSGDEAEIAGPYTAAGPWQDGEFWSDYVMADTVVLEYLPADGSETLPFRLTAVSHLLPQAVAAHLATAGGKSDFRKRAASALERNNAAASCNLDVSCYDTWSDAARSVTHLVYENDGGSFACSGTLVVTRNASGTPYLLTASHCVNNNRVARTVQTFWGYQTRSCNGQPVLRRDADRVLGATYLAGAGVSQGDYALLLLTEAPPNAYFAGWDPAELENGTAVTGMHHPDGDYKRISFGVSAPSRTPAFHRIHFNDGVVQTGSSGSGIFTRGGYLRGVLSTGPKRESPEEYCAMREQPVDYGRFSVIYNALQDYFEERRTGSSDNPGQPPSDTPAAITSGNQQRFTIPALSQATLLNGSSGYVVEVPEGATRLEVQLTTETSGVEVDLYVRYENNLDLSGSGVIADHRATTPGGNETISVTAASTPPLRAGKYFIAMAVLTPSVEVKGSMVATVSTTAPETGTLLKSGEATEFSLGPVTKSTLFRDPAYRIEVPADAESLEIEIQSRADFDLYAAFNTPVSLQGTRPVADHLAETESGSERIVITRESNPPLRTGTYYMAVGLYSYDVVATGTITATVRKAETAPEGPKQLVMGEPQAFQLPAVEVPTIFHGDYSFYVDVPEEARRLVVKLNTTTEGADADLYVRYGADNVLHEGNVVTDYVAETVFGNETIIIGGDSDPPLRPGRYFISMLVYSEGTAAAGTVTATIQTQDTPEVIAGKKLNSGQRERFALPPEPVSFLHNGDRTFSIEVPEGSARLTIELKSTVPSVDVDLYVRHGEDTWLDDDGVVADFTAATESGAETIVISDGSNPSLKPGTYYISVGVYTKDVSAAGLISATIEQAVASSRPSPAKEITPGAPQRFELPATAGLLTGAYGYSVYVPSASGRLEIDIRPETPGADMGLYVRYGVEPESVDDKPFADHRLSRLTEGSKLVIDGQSIPPLRPGHYYIALAQFSDPKELKGEIVVNYDGPVGAPVEPARSAVPSSGSKHLMGVISRLPASARDDFQPLSKKLYKRSVK